MPKCIIAGTPKGGTCALREMLSMHSRVAQATGEDTRQIKFLHENFQRGFAWYLNGINRESCFLYGSMYNA